jgi:hypothetical protein
MPFRLKLDELNAMLNEYEVRKMIDRREQALDLVFAPEPPVDPLGDREQTRQIFLAYAAAGATGLSMRFVHDSRSHYVEQMEAAVGLLRELDDV